jgi:parallel beta-helix repeat protein
MSVLAAVSVFDTPIDLVDTASGAILYVNTTGSDGAFTSIQDAVNSSANGDTVYVFGGTYYGNLEVNKSINLVGEDWETTTLNGEGSVYLVEITADWVNMSGFTVKKSGSTPGILIKSNNNSVYDNNVRQNNDGIFLLDSYGCSIYNNTVYSNEWEGIYLHASNGNTVTGNDIKSNGQVGINLRDSSSNCIMSNTANGNEWGFYANNSTMNNITDNTFSHNSINGLHLSESHKNTIARNHVSQSDNFGMRIKHSDNNIIVRNTLERNDKGMCLSFGYYNLIYHNNFLGNTEQASDTVGRRNLWNISYPKGGNYWSDYTGSDDFRGLNQSFNGSDGIGDTPHAINQPGPDDLVDNYPLMSPYAPSPLFPQISLLSPANNTLIRAGGFLDFNVEDDYLNYVSLIINGGEETIFYHPYDLHTKGWGDGDYVIKIYALDFEMNSNSSLYFFTFDSSPPQIRYNSTVMESTIRAGEIIPFNISDPNLDSVAISVDGGEYSVFPEPYTIDTSNWTNGIHTVSIITNDTLGNEIEEELEVEIDAIAPTVISTSPTNNAKNVKINTTITIIFSEQMNRSNVSYYIIIHLAEPLINLNLTWDASGTILTISFYPGNLSGGTKYRIVINSQIHDINGTPMSADYELEFTTVSLDPSTDFFGTGIDGMASGLILLILAVIIASILLGILLSKGKKKTEPAEEEQQAELPPPPMKEKQLPPPPPPPPPP